MIILIIIAIIALPIIWGIMVNNKLVGLRNNVKAAESTVDAMLERRADLIPNLVNTVKGYAKHEQETLDKVMQQRAAVMNAANFANKVEADNQLSKTLGHLFAVTENYPELKSNQNFLALQEELTTTENKIAGSRYGYIASVRDYNTSIEKFPNSIIAGMGHFTHIEEFKVDNRTKENVKVEF